MLSQVGIKEGRLLLLGIWTLFVLCTSSYNFTLVVCIQRRYNNITCATPEFQSTPCRHQKSADTAIFACQQFVELTSFFFFFFFLLSKAPHHTLGNIWGNMLPIVCWNISSNKLLETCCSWMRKVSFLGNMLSTTLHKLLLLNFSTYTGQHGACIRSNMFPDSCLVCGGA